MSIRIKAILATIVALTALIAVLNIAMVFAVRRTFGEMETESAKKSIQRGTTVVDSAVKSLNAAIYDWAVWDDTYNFVQGKNSGYVDSNISNESIANLHLNVMLYYDKNGRLILGKAVNLETKEGDAVPEGLLAMLQSEPKFLHHQSPESCVSGFLITKHGPIAFSAHAITTSDKSGQPVGTLVFGRYLDDRLVNKLSQDYGLSLKVATLNSGTLADDFSQAAKSISSKEEKYPIIPLSKEKIASYGTINDVSGKPALIVRVDSDREIHKQSLAMVRYTTVGLLMAGIIFAILNILWLDRNVLRKIVHLDQFVSGVINELGLGERPSEQKAA